MYKTDLTKTLNPYIAEKGEPAMVGRLYCGIDLHKKFSFVCVMNDKGEIKDERKLWHDGFTFKEYFKSRETMECVVEPVESWGWVTDYLEETGHKVHLANTYKVRLIAESRMKTDRVDAKVLADLLRAGYLPEGYVAPVGLRDRRAYLRYRIMLARERARLKVHVKRLLMLENVSEPVYKDTFGKKGMEWLKGLKLREVNNRIKNERIEGIERYNVLINKMESEIRSSSNRDERAKLLKTIPGIGPLTAEVIMAEVGEMGRFRTSKHFASYTGLVSSQRSSGGKTHYGRITKSGSKYLRWLFVEAAQRAKRNDTNLKRFFDRIAYKKGRGVAIVALARKLAEICWCVAIYEESYNTDKVCRQVG